MPLTPNEWCVRVSVWSPTSDFWIFSNRDIVTREIQLFYRWLVALLFIFAQELRLQSQCSSHTNIQIYEREYVRTHERRNACLLRQTNSVWCWCFSLKIDCEDKGIKNRKQGINEFCEIVWSMWISSASLPINLNIFKYIRIKRQKVEKHVFRGLLDWTEAVRRHSMLLDIRWRRCHVGQVFTFWIEHFTDLFVLLDVRKWFHRTFGCAKSYGWTGFPRATLYTISSGTCHLLLSDNSLQRYYSILSTVFPVIFIDLKYSNIRQWNSLPFHQLQWTITRLWTTAHFDAIA